MSTSADTIIYLSDQLTQLGDRIRTRKMFGEYALYCDQKVVALVCDDQLYLKVTEPGLAMLGPTYQQASPYPGSKLINRYNDLDIYSHPDNLISSIEELNAKNVMVIG